MADGKPVGFIELALRPYATSCDSSPVPYVEGWFVEANDRARGIGKALMQIAETWARDGGFTELASDALLDNDASLRAHLRCGFAVTQRMVMFRKSLTAEPEWRLPHCHPELVEGSDEHAKWWCCYERAARVREIARIPRARGSRCARVVRGPEVERCTSTAVRCANLRSA